MAETNKSKMMSEAEIIEAINADTLVSVSLGEGQPQKNVKLSTLASVVAERLGLKSNTYFINRGDITTSADDAKLTGLYSYTGGQVINGTSYGILVCFLNFSFETNYAWGFQLFVGDNKKMSMRSSIRNNTVWGEWILMN